MTSNWDHLQKARWLSSIRGSEAGALESWLGARREASDSSVQRIPLKDLRRWDFDRSGGFLRLRHDSGRFFSVEGVRIRTNLGNLGPGAQWDQAIIRQPERGLLGIAARIRDGILEFLIQAKMEPGCVNAVQASPTIQATRSNYTRVHRGRTPEYYELFADYRPTGTWLTRSPQIEQTTRFLGKKNINAVRLLASDSFEGSVEPSMQPSDDFRWCTLRDIKELYLKNNLVNMNARSILACLPPLNSREPIDARELLAGNPAAASLLERLYASLRTDGDTRSTAPDIAETMLWFHEMRERLQVETAPRSLDKLEGWTLDEDSIHGDYFSVIAVRVQARREVSDWDQPLVAQPENGLAVLVGKTVEGRPSFLLQAKCDAGGDPAVHLAPTVSCSVPSMRRRTSWAPAFLDTVMDRPETAFVFDTTLSEEGGRFQHCRNDYKILWDEHFPEKDIPENYRWVSYPSMFELVRHAYLNIEARSLFGFLV